MWTNDCHGSVNLISDLLSRGGGLKAAVLVRFRKEHK